MNRVTNIVWRTASGARLGGFAYRYDVLGRIVSRSHDLGGASFGRDYAYDDLDRLSSDGGVTYTYDAAGHRVQISHSGSAMSETRTDEYSYNIRGELISATKNAEDAKIIEYQYQYDDIGNRITSLDLGTNRTYAANNLNQYTLISNLCASASLREEFIPQFDNDGNQTLIKTDTGIWQVSYNGENRPVLWECVSTNSPTHNSSTPTLISMSYDRMGRRITKNNQRFVYDSYLQVANFDSSDTNSQLTTHNSQHFIWDPTEPVATRPLVWQYGDSLPSYYTHDGNKNVSEVVSFDNSIQAHYEYAPFGLLSCFFGSYAFLNLFHFSSEYTDLIGVLYYNFRFVNYIKGCWISRDSAGEFGGINLYSYCMNNLLLNTDYLGESICCTCSYGGNILPQNSSTGFSVILKRKCSDKSEGDVLYNSTKYQCYPKFFDFIGNCLTKKCEVLTLYKCERVYARINLNKYTFYWIFIREEVGQCK